MRIVFIGTGEIGLPTLRALLRTPKHEVVGVVTQPDKPVGRDQRSKRRRSKRSWRRPRVPIFQPARFETTKQSRRFARSRRT